MAKHNKNKQKNTPAQLAPLYAEMYRSHLLGMGEAQGLRSKLVQVNFDILDKMAEKNPLVNAIIQKRTQQIRPFCSLSTEEGERGFVLKAIDGKADPKRVRELANFLINTGWKEDEDREDDLPDFVQLLVRDVLVFDQNAAEIRRTRGGEVFDFWYVDGTSVYRLSEKSPEYNEGYRFAQKNEDGRLVAFFKPRDLIFDYMNKRGRLRFRGYGYSCLEQMVDLLTTILFSLAYNKDLFVKDKIPRGFLKVTGDVDTKSMNAIRNYWVSEMSGYGARFTVPIIPSTKEGVGIDWMNLTQSNRDMEYRQLVLLLISLACAVFSIDPAELGIRTETSQSIIGESGEPRLQNSRDTGLGSLLAYAETFLNKILKMVDPNYVLKFVGLKDDDALRKEDLYKKRLDGYMTIDEVREKQGLKPFNQPWSTVVLNSSTVQIVAQSASMGGMGAATEEAGIEGTEESAEEPETETGEQGGEEEAAIPEEGEGSEGEAGGLESRKAVFGKSHIHVRKNEFVDIIV